MDPPSLGRSKKRFTYRVTSLWQTTNQTEKGSLNLIVETVYDSYIRYPDEDPRDKAS